MTSNDYITPHCTPHKQIHDTTAVSPVCHASPLSTVSPFALTVSNRRARGEREALGAIASGYGKRQKGATPVKYS